MEDRILEKHKNTGTDVDDEFKEKLMNTQYLDTAFDPRTKTS